MPGMLSRIYETFVQSASKPSTSSPELSARAQEMCSSISNQTLAPDAAPIVFFVNHLEKYPISESLGPLEMLVRAGSLSAANARNTWAALKLGHEYQRDKNYSDCFIEYGRASLNGDDSGLRAAARHIALQGDACDAARGLAYVVRRLKIARDIEHPPVNARHPSFIHADKKLLADNPDLINMLESGFATLRTEEAAKLIPPGTAPAF